MTGQPEKQCKYHPDVALVAAWSQLDGGAMFWRESEIVPAWVRPWKCPVCSYVEMHAE